MASPECSQLDPNLLLRLVLNATVSPQQQQELQQQQQLHQQFQIQQVRFHAASIVAVLPVLLPQVHCCPWSHMGPYGPTRVGGAVLPDLKCAAIGVLMLTIIMLYKPD